MIQSRIFSKGRVTVPPTVRMALGIEPGDEIVWQIEGGCAVMKRVTKRPAF